MSSALISGTTSGTSGSMRKAWLLSTTTAPRFTASGSNSDVYKRQVYDIAKEIEAKTGRETRVAIPGHTQRGGQPNAQDRIFATQCGVEAALGCLRGEFGYMIALRDGKMCHMPLEDVAGKLKYVDPQSDLVREAKALGISFGDE